MKILSPHRLVSRGIADGLRAVSGSVAYSRAGL